MTVIAAWVVISWWFIRETWNAALTVADLAVTS